MRLSRAVRFVAVALVAAPAALAPLATLAPLAAQAAGSGWTVRRDALAELWYHGVAVVGAPRYGPLPLYADDYAATHAPAPGAALGRAAPALRAALAADTAFEVLHFVPLWFVGERPDEVLAALRLALGPRPPTGGRLAPRAAAVAAALDGPARRATALAFVDALAEEWRSSSAAARGVDDTTLAALQRRWDAVQGAALVPLLARAGRARGVILPVPSVGLEGRIATLPDGGTIVVVGVDVAEPDAPLLAAVRELAYPLLDAGAARDTRDRLAREREREIAAVRAGALLLDAVLPGAAEAYRRLYASAAAGGGAPTFERAYPVSAATERAIRSAVSRFTARQGAR